MWLLGFGIVAGVLIYQAFFVEGPQEFKHIAWGFLVIGIAMILPRWLALRYWALAQARIVDVQEGNDMQDIKYVYEFAGKEYFGKLQETGLHKKGDWLTILVNPEKPDSSISMTTGVVFLGLLFVVVALLTLASIE